MDSLSSPSAESPPLRQTTTGILGSFLRARPRGASHSHAAQPVLDTTRNSPPLPSLPSPVTNAPSSTMNPPSPGLGSHRRRPAGAPALQTPSGSVPASAHTFGQILRRRRSGGTLASTTTPQAPIVAARPINTSTSHAAPTPGIAASAPTSAMPSALSAGPRHRIRLVPHIDSRRSLRFEPIMRDVAEHDLPLRIGRFTDRSGMGVAAHNALGSNKLAFKSKVVSRAHAEVWCEAGGKFFIRDTKSSSGTFLNHVRLSAANQESRAFEIKDGDTLQLGVDYQGGTEDIYKCVRIRIEIGREWQNSANAFNTNALRQLKALAEPLQAAAAGAKSGPKKSVPKSGFGDCCICLFAVSIQQALFIAPCSHAFHYKCIRPMLDTHHPAFSCPLCRTFADLEADVEVDVEVDVEDEQEREPETEVDESGVGTARVRRPPNVLDLAEEDSDVEPAAVPPHVENGGSVEPEQDSEAMVVDEPDALLPRGSPMPSMDGEAEAEAEAEADGSRSGSSVGEVEGEGSGASGEGMAGMMSGGEDDRAVKRKR
ncbi:SMAD/FHA domain-containing protein [Dentipellis sp. KUC8613]|nr:SMAD/FHA domain-containing protein [Dentipellis sp. KUC8613]